MAPARTRSGQLAAAANCEIGAHLHAWSTPPLSEVDKGVKHSYLHEYAAAVQRDKLTQLTDTIEGVFGMRPTSYRARALELGCDRLGVTTATGL